MKALPAPGLVVRLAEDGFDHYVASSDFSFMVEAYAQPQADQPVVQWKLDAVRPYRKCYSIDSEQFRDHRGSSRAAIFVAWFEGTAVGHLAISTHWNGLAYIDELAVAAQARRHGVARTLLDVAQFWTRRQLLPGIMLETQNNNLGACRLYESCGFVLGGSDALRYRGIDPDTCEVALFWYLMLPQA
ncbi:GNAT family N-acetyltransferase [Pseudomonas sp. dw_358]|uniref:GNAT family N-acetyltransferase n=1 Tax=Pseudomonas sp. dw_358 TaxID=2720083 RepID=UPI001BD2A00D|nr:GNAT family N-acetyltransferase [Pseudomonas sp. dw_358]